jgi:hypothetical protein
MKRSNEAEGWQLSVVNTVFDRVHGVVPTSVQKLNVPFATSAGFCGKSLLLKESWILVKIILALKKQIKIATAMAIS